MGKQYIAKIDNLYLQGKDTTSDIEEADIFESETEPRQRINQMKKDGKLNKNAKITIKALEESKNKLFKNVFKESSGDMSLEEYCDSVNSDANYIEAFKDWVKEGIHGRDILSRSRWDEIWDDFGGTFYDDEEEEVTQFQVDVDAEKPLKVWKDGSRWKCSDGSTYMSYLKPQDVVHWLRKDYGKAWLVESTRLKERFLDYDTWDKFYDEGIEAYLAGKTLSEAPITGNAWFSEAWQEGWQHAKDCDEEDIRAEAEEEYLEEYGSMQESKIKESNLVDSYNNILKDIKDYILMCNDSEDRFSGKKSFDLSKRIFIGNLSKTYMIDTNHLEEWFRKVESDLIKQGYSFWWNRLQESKIKVLYDNLTEEIRNFILHDDEMDSFSGFDSYEFARNSFIEKLSDKYEVTTDCIEELFFEVEFDLAHEGEEIPFKESKVSHSRKRIKEDSLDDPDIDLSQSYKGKDLEILKSFQNDAVEFLKEVFAEELSEKGFSKCKFPKKDGYRVFVGGLFSKKIAEPGSNIYITLEIGEYGKIRANGVDYSAEDLANTLNEAIKYYSINDIQFNIDSIHQASIYGDSGQWIIRFKCEVPEDILD